MIRFSRPLVFAICASSLIDVATDTPSVRGHWLGPFFQLTPATQLTSACCAAALTLLALFMLVERSGDGSGAAPEPRGAAGGHLFSRLVRLLPATSMLYALFWTQPHVDPAFAVPWNAMVVAAPIFIGVSAFRRWPPLWTAAVVAVVGVTLRLVHFARFSIDEGADMLPLTQSALSNFLAGKNPYTYYDLPGPVPLTYYPLTWLAFLPPYLAHVDLRWTNIVAEMAVFAAIVRAGSGEKAGAKASHGAASFMNAEGVAVLVWSFQFLLPSSVYFDRITTAPVAWALISWCIVLLARESEYAWVMLGLTAAGTPLASILVPFAFVTWWQRHSPREAAIRTLSAGLVAGVILAPFVIGSPRGFIDGAVLWFNDLSRYPGVTWRAYQPWARYIGFGGLFWREGLERALAPIQWLLVAGVTVLFARRRARSDLLASHVAGAFVAFMVFNSVNWPYFYQPAIYAALLITSRAHGGLCDRQSEDRAASELVHAQRRLATSRSRSARV
jgi:hypothetical protein